MMRPLADILDDVLADLGIDAKPAGTGRARDKIEGRSRAGAAPQFAAARKNSAAVRLAWVNPAAIREAPSQEGKPGASRMIVVK